MKKELITVGIGASAGGLEAINEFFDHIGPNTGMAFIVVQHLSPDFKSLMDELLSKHTKMPIEVIHQPTPVKPNHIYLISKESNIIIKDGIIRPVDRKDRHVVNLPIDEFFHSLGEDQREHSVGVILSGTGTDGSRGVGTIKEAGGLVLVQEPESAQFDGMPKAAIEAGFADNVLPPFAIAKSLMNLVKSNDTGYLLFLNPDDKVVERTFYQILDLVHDQIGVNFTEYRKTTLYRRVEKRMFLTRKNTIGEYLELIKDGEKEINNLYKEFLIGVTRFFRDDDAFELLNTNVVCRIVEDTPKTEPIRIWVAACSTGEEAYSLAMLFQECIERTGIKRKFKIFASDLDSHAISIASKGIYGKEITDSIPPEYLNKYFTSTPLGELIVGKMIREKIVFTVHDALNDPPFINLDLISCRNFLIYLKPIVQQKLLVNFQFALKHQGYLFLGPSESLGKTKSAFEAVSERWNIFQNVLESNLRPNQYDRNKLRERKRTNKAPLQDLSVYEEKIVPSNEEVYASWLMHQYVPLLMFVNEELDVLYINGDAERLLSFPRGPGAFNLNKMLGENELLVFKNGLRKTIENEKNNVYKDITFRKKNSEFKLDLSFQPVDLRQVDDSVILITIKIIGEGKSGTLGNKEVEEVDETTYHQERVKTLDLELRQVRSEKQNLVERLETTNEELQSSNEELLAANEELQSTNEELQSVNEELYTVNSELQGKVSELTMSNNDMDNLLKSTGIGTVFVDDMLNIRRFTPAVKKQFNLLPSDIGRPITTFVSTFTKENIYEDFKKVLKNSKKVEREVIDDLGHPYLMRLLPYRLENRKTDGVVATFVDVEDIKAASRKAESLAEKFQLLFKHSEDHISFYDDEWNMLDINVVPDGYVKPEIIGQNLLSLIPEKSHKFFEDAFAKLKKTKQPVQFNAPIVLPTGELHWYEQVLVPLQSKSGKDQYLLISKDITGIKITEREINRKAAIFNGLFKYSNSHITIMDKDGVIKDINFTSAGWTKEDLIGKNMVDIAPTPEIKKQTTNALKSIKRGESYVFYNTRFIGPDQQEHYFENSLFSVNTGKEVEDIIVVSKDVTEAKKLEKSKEASRLHLVSQVEARSKELSNINMELEEANSYLDSFVHGAAHDLRSPLTQIQGYLSLLPEIEEEEDRLGAYQELGDASHRMERILNGLVELIDFKKNVKPIVKQIKFSELFEKILVDLKPYITKSEAVITAKIPKGLTITYIEAFLNSVIYNLVHNAIKYRAYNRKLTINITAKKEKEFVVFKVEDNGIGMDMQRYGHFLFQPFKRLTVDRPGTGIGLSIINNSVRRNGGRIDVISRLDKGTTFTVYLMPYELD